MLSNSLSLSNASSGWIGLSPIDTLVQRACEPSLGEPPYNLHLELSEHINNKKANTPREAAHSVLRLVNSRNPHVALLALSLLDTLVKQCGYPFHLQIGTKEFLNEMVKRFPERPPPYPGPVMAKILEMINEWKETICTDSRWKEDLTNIRDMWRLLSFKGYRFKERRRDALAPSTSALKSAEELENDDRTAQEAKLQELIRRGTPRDLAAAQDLMKVLAGADPEQKPNYKAQALSELTKLESKVILMNELLDNVKTSVSDGTVEKFVKGDVYDQVSQVLLAARPKIQKWIADAQVNTDGGGENDPESLDTFLTLNDQINSVVNRYESYKKGDFSLDAVPVELKGSSTSQPAAKSDLIDLDFLGSSSSAVGAQGGASNDLAGLFSSTPSSSAQPVQQHHQGASAQPLDLNKLYKQSPSPGPGGGGMGGMAAAGAYGGIALPTTPLPGQMFNPAFNAPAATNAMGGPFGGYQRTAATSAHPVATAAGAGPGGVGFGWAAAAATPQQQQPIAPTMTPMNVRAGVGAGVGATGLMGATGVGANGAAAQTQQQAQRNAKDPFADLVDLL